MQGVVNSLQLRFLQGCNDSKIIVGDMGSNRKKRQTQKQRNQKGQDLPRQHSLLISVLHFAIPPQPSLSPIKKLHRSCVSITSNSGRMDQAMRRQCVTETAIPEGGIQFPLGGKPIAPRKNYDFEHGLSGLRWT